MNAVYASSATCEGPIWRWHGFGASDMREPLSFSLSDDEMREIVTRAREQEAVYGHNTGHFSLNVEKENTITGVAGEWAVRKVLRDSLAELPDVSVNFTPIGAPVDLLMERPGVTPYGIHVKTGMWRKWPRDEFEFGIHADQGIQSGTQPLVLVTLLRGDDGLPSVGRIEGFVTPQYLRECEVIHSGERFPRSRVVSRTTNIVTTFGRYQHLELLRREIAESFE